MRRQHLHVLIAGLVAMLLCSAVGLAVEAESKVEAVTLYRDQALVTRAVQAEVPAGASELVVGDMPQQVLPDSLFVSAADDVQVRAVRFRTRAVAEEPREEIRQIDQQVQKLQDDLRRNEAMRRYVDERRQYLDKLEAFTAPTAQVELSKGVLNAETLQSLTRFDFDQRKNLVEELLRLETEQRTITEQINLLQRRKAELTAGSTRTVREAVVFLDRPQAGAVELRLSYLVGNAGWEPTYNLRAAEGQANVTLEYNATVHQMSGEDWPEVGLTLSTASPTLMAKGPELAPFWVALGTPPQPLAQPQVEQQAEQYAKQLKMSQVAQRAAPAARDEEQANWEMNLAASGLQGIEVAAPGSELRRLRLREPVPTEGWSVTYALPGRISLASRADRQMVQIAGPKLPSTFYHVATPLLTEYIYREAEVLNGSDLALLEGPATCYLDGRFVGRSRVPMAAQGQRFRTGFGLNSQMRAARELLDKTETTLGGNRQQQFHCRLTLENYGEQAVAVQLYDRIPEPTGGADLRVTLGEMTKPLSEDATYLDRERRRGILRWDVEVPAKTAAPNAYKLEYHYSLEFDRKLSVLPLTETGEMKREFEELLQRRMKAQ